MTGPPNGTGRFAGQGFAQDLDSAGSGPAVDDVDLGERDVGEFFVVPDDGRGRSEEAYVEAIVAALAIQQGNELVEAGGATAAAAKREAARGAIQQVAIGDQNAQRGAAGSLVGDADGGFFHVRRAAIRAQQNAHAKSLRRERLRLFRARRFRCVKDFLPGTLSTRREMCIDGGYFVRVGNKRAKILCIVKAMGGRPERESHRERRCFRFVRAHGLAIEFRRRGGAWCLRRRENFA